MTSSEFAAVVIRLDDIKADVEEIKQHNEKTIDRVSTLEVWRGYMTGAVAVLMALTVGIGVPVAVAVLA